MVHVTELSWGRIKNPAEVLSVGDQVEVYVISFDKEKRKISLGYKNPEDNPWTKFTSTYEVGAVAEVKIVKLMAFGAFAEVIPGVDGLIHISQMADKYISDPSEVLHLHQHVKVRVVEVDRKRNRIALSLKGV